MDLLAALRRLFVARANPLTTSPVQQSERGSKDVRSIQTGESETPQPESPVFLTAQSLATFPGAALAINILWNLVALVNKDFAKQTIVPIILGFFVGMVIYFISSAGLPQRQKIIGFGIAIINSGWLVLNALGISIGKPPS